MTTAAVLHSVWEWVGLWIYWSGEALGFAMLPVILFSRRSPQAKVAWILLAIGFPWIGVLAYLLFGRRRMHRQVVRLRERSGASFAQVEREMGAACPLPRRPSGRPAAELVEGDGGDEEGYLIPGNRVVPLLSGPDAFGAARAAIEGAKHHVHLVTYIFKDDRTGHVARDLLEASVRRGIEVRVLVDGLGGASPGLEFLAPIVHAGGEASDFLPVGRVLTNFRANLRNHRKLLVVDGAVAFTGGMNVADEYAMKDGWVDAHASLRGPVVTSLQRVFAEDWHFATGRLLSAEAYFPRQAPAGDVSVRVVASGPDQDEPAAEEHMFRVITSARRTVDVMTPYLVPTEPIEEALRVASKRGCRVRILYGEPIDHRTVRWASEAYMPRLIAAGIEIWCHPRMIHGKVVTVDGRFVTLGSTNLDARSLRLNFELNVAVPNVAIAREVTHWFDAQIAVSRLITPEELAAAGWGRRVLRAAAELFSPVL